MSGSNYLSRTFSTPTNANIWTMSVWIKPNSESSYMFSPNTDNGHSNFSMSFNAMNMFAYSNSGTTYWWLTPTAVYRDPNGWYHVVVAYDSPQATASNRVKMYVNGTQVTSFSQADYPAQNTGQYYNTAVQHLIGRRGYSTDYGFTGSLTHMYFVDGQALTPSSFGETDATTGIWKPKAYTGTYGTNGFFLKFENGGSLGTDSSGNGNNWTVNGTLIQTVDTPSNVFATLNSINVTPSGGHTFSNGNTQVTIGVVDAATPATLGVKSGKWYWETKWTQKGGTDRYGVMPEDASNQIAPHVTGIAWNEGSAEMWLLSSSYSGSWGSNPATNDIIMFALDYDNKAFYMGVNGTWRNSGVPTSGASRTGAVNFSSTSLDGKYLLPCVGKGNGGTSTWQMNFGNGYFATTAISSPYSDGAGLGKFQYQPPTGYYALCTKNINVYG